MPRFDARERHAIHGIAAPPAEVLRRALALPVAPDGVVRTLFRLRGLSPRGTLEHFFAAGATLERTATTVVVGLRANRHGFVPVASAEAWAGAADGHAIAIVVDLRATEAAAGTSVSTETRVRASTPEARRVFRLYWSVVGIFSAWIRRRWLRAIARACRQASAPPRRRPPSTSDRRRRRGGP